MSKYFFKKIFILKLLNEGLKLIKNKIKHEKKKIEFKISKNSNSPKEKNVLLSTNKIEVKIRLKLNKKLLCLCNIFIKSL